MDVLVLGLDHWIPLYQDNDAEDGDVRQGREHS
jgi:hypothetical protein